MKTSRARFKYALRNCKKNEETCKADALAYDLSQNDIVSFWKKVKQNNISSCLSNKIDGITGEREIAETWKVHYEHLLNSISNNCKKSEVLDEIRVIDRHENMNVHHSEIFDIVYKM